MTDNNKAGKYAALAALGLTAAAAGSAAANPASPDTSDAQGQGSPTTQQLSPVESGLRKAGATSVEQTSLSKLPQEYQAAIKAAMAGKTGPVSVGNGKTVMLADLSQDQQAPKQQAAPIKVQYPTQQVTPAAPKPIELTPALKQVTATPDAPHQVTVTPSLNQATGLTPDAPHKVIVTPSLNQATGLTPDAPRKVIITPSLNQATGLTPDAPRKVIITPSLNQVTGLTPDAPRTVIVTPYLNQVTGVTPILAGHQEPQGQGASPTKKPSMPKSGL